MQPATSTARDGTRLNKVLLLRLDPAGFDAATQARAADGVVAYSAICPHTGCEVAKWLAETQRLECPCHFSQYDPKRGPQWLAGPSPRPLPALPLKAVDGRLVVAKPFTGRLGVSSRPEFGRPDHTTIGGENRHVQTMPSLAFDRRRRIWICCCREPLWRKSRCRRCRNQRAPAPVPAILQNYKPVTARAAEEAGGRRLADGSAHL